jgi:hypothetical protein
VAFLRLGAQEFIRMANIAKGSLPPAGQRLIEMMQR